MHIVTAGSEFLDIDAYAGTVAYAELLSQQDIDAIAASSADLNESITPTIRSWKALFTTGYKPDAEDVFALIDVSEPRFFDPIVELEKVVAVIDHHTGFESLWSEKLGDKAKIEFIGAACTLVYEEWVAARKFDKMSQLSARLLTAGILDNTLNFEANVTTERDRTAYIELMKRADLSAEWPAQYFSECQAGIETNLALALQNDTKTLRDELRLPPAFGQLVVWDAQHIAANRADEITETLFAMIPESATNPDWGINLVSISEGSSYFMAGTEASRARLEKLLGITFSNGLAQADRLWLRKEIIKKAEEDVAASALRQSK